jgi:hypothetical protein
LPYEKPRLIAIAPASTNPGEQRLVITGGLPQLPGTRTIFPHVPPEPYVPPPEPVKVETEVGTCTVSETNIP